MADATSTESGSLPPRILLVMSNHWERVLLRAELLERGLDAVGTPDVGMALLHPAFVEGRGPVRVILIDGDVLAAYAPRAVEFLASRHGRPPVVLLTSTQLAEPRGPWSRVLRRPAAIGEIATTLEQLARSVDSGTVTPAGRPNHSRGHPA